MFERQGDEEKRTLLTTSQKAGIQGLMSRQKKIHFASEL
jgi:hypothetical protein